MEDTYIKFKNKIIIKPKMIIYRNKVYKVTSVDKKYILEGYIIYKNYKGKLTSIKTDNKKIHPKYDINNDELCLPPTFYGKIVTPSLLKMISIYLSVWNLDTDSCIYPPLQGITMELMDNTSYILKEDLERETTFLNSLTKKFKSFFNQI